ncbi:fatty acid degradation protein [Caballeronia sordidicola]|uniref:Fatty acid degradation protein n=1 Tax=Caballeronia sordidicola TaxID=196367 RepID=A0A158I038_CABSO|nr:3-hydroxyacyl-CoA dehydrogenase NAD-binding domain-containing protein [Caballeronia sordidicola]SAL49928.1 fatty acid degradation protein [Caballeronia sordidicola]
MATNVTKLSVFDGVAVITLDNPPVNSLGHALRQEIVLSLQAAQSDARVQGIVLAGTGKAFSAGADITEFVTSRHLQEPILRIVLSEIEACDKPVVAAIEGVALGGGLELALACHGRVALASARVGLPEVTFGLIPGSGGTQRLPRLIGITAAYAMMTSAQPRMASQFHGTRLFDSIVRDGVLDAAIGYTKTLIARGAPYARARDLFLDAEHVRGEVALQRDALTARQKLQPAYGALLDALAAVALPFDEGMKKERERFISLLTTTASHALRYQFKAEREAVKVPKDAVGSARAVHTVAIIGAGTMGTGIAIAAIDAGLSCFLIEQDKAALERGQQRIVKHYEKQLVAGKIGTSEAAARRTRLSSTLDWARLQEADLIIEAVFEDLEIKQSVFKKIDSQARPGAVLATNTSYLDVDAVASATSRAQDVLGLHFFSPANVMKLLEVVRGARTAPDVIATGMALGTRLQKTPVLTKNAFGFVGNRIYNAYRRQCEFMLEDGAWPEDVDGALTSFGFSMGPFAVADLSGLDIAWRMRRAQTPPRDPRERYVDILDQLCAMDRLGRKAGAGYYRYTDGKRVETTDAVVRGLIEQASARRGILRKPLTAYEIQRRALLAMVNEAARLMAEGVAARPSDVDVVLVQGYGFPRWEGGPVFWARQQDRVVIEAELKQLAEDAGYGFVLADLTPLLLVSED